MGVSTWRYAKPPKPKERQPTETGPRYGEWAGRGPERASRGPPVLAKTPAPGHTSVFFAETHVMSFGPRVGAKTGGPQGSYSDLWPAGSPH